MTAAATIACVLSERGYDFEIAHIFALQAQAAGRLTTAQTLTEAVTVVADMMMPTGVWAATGRSPIEQHKKPAGRETRPLNATTISHGSWLIA